MFLHRLALKLGRTVNELENTISFQEMLDWAAYAQLEPWGREEQQADLRHAMLVKMVSDLHHWMAGSESRLELTDFMLYKKLFQRNKAEPVVDAEVIEVPEERKGAKIDDKLLTQLFLVSAKG